MATWFVILLALATCLVVGIWFPVVFLVALGIVVLGAVYFFGQRRRSDLRTDSEKPASNQPHGAGQG